jgi:hypothetical protein
LLHPEDPIERLDGETKRHTDVVDIFCDDEAIVPLLYV